jgi:chorismate mutase
MSPEDAEIVAEARRRLQNGGPGIPSERVMEMLSRLQQLHENGEVSDERIQGIVQDVVTNVRQ